MVCLTAEVDEEFGGDNASAWYASLSSSSPLKALLALAVLSLRGRMLLPSGDPCCIVGDDDCDLR
jgi:hypothetical protein